MGISDIQSNSKIYEMMWQDLCTAHEVVSLELVLLLSRSMWLFVRAVLSSSKSYPLILLTLPWLKCCPLRDCMLVTCLDRLSIRARIFRLHVSVHLSGAEGLKDTIRRCSASLSLLSHLRRAFSSCFRVPNAFARALSLRFCRKTSLSSACIPLRVLTTRERRSTWSASFLVDVRTALESNPWSTVSIRKAWNREPGISVQCHLSSARTGAKSGDSALSRG